MSSRSGTGGTGPEALPKLTIRPRGLRQSSELWNVAAPTESYTTGTPLPPVSALTRSANGSEPSTISSAPWARAMLAFSAVLTTPITRAPSASARGGVKYDRVALPHAVGPAQQVLDGEPLEHHGGGLLVADPGRDFDQPVGRHVT